MKNTFKKALATVLALMMLVSALPMAFAATEVASGTAGEGVNWVLDSDGTLTISGNGPIVVGWFEPPWKAYNDSILNIVVEEGITKIPSSAFCHTKNCVSVSISASVETVETSVTPFCVMNSLEKIIVDETNAAFKSVDGILFSKDGKTLIFFPNNQGLTEYTVPDTVETISDYAFYVNVSLRKITVPDTVTYIGYSAFEYSDVEQISLGNGIDAFYTYLLSNTDIKSFVVPDSVKTLGFGVFYNCNELETLVIGSGVETIVQDVVYSTDKLTAVHYNGTQEDWDKITINEDNEDLFAKELHFVSQKEGVDPTCADGHTAGLYCSDCDEYFTGEVIPAVKDHISGSAVDENVVTADCDTAGSKDVVTYCTVCTEELSRETVETEPAKGHSINSEGVCGACGATCDHSSAEYVKTADTHQLNCTSCGKTDGPQPHRIIYNEAIDGGKCAPYCEVCGLVDVLAKPHSMTAYDKYDNEYCILYCTNCGYGDETTGLVKHSFEKTVVPATEKEAEYTKTTCSICEYFYKEYNTENTITFKLYSEYGQWENSAILAYVNGKPVTLIRNMTGNEYDTYALPYDKNSSYVFKWIDGGYSEMFGVEIYLPDSEDAVYDETDMSGYDMLQTIYTVNVADYSDVDDALAQIPDYLEWYSADSVAALVTAVKGVERMLPAGKQAEVDAMAAAIENAVDGLVELDDPVPNGVINMSAGNYVYINDSYFSEKPGYTHFNSETSDEIFYEYEGKYVILETEPKDEGNEDYVHCGIYTYTGEVEFDLVNTYITGYWGNFGIYNDSDVTLNLFGANAFACYYWEDDDEVGIEIEEDAKLHIKDSKGSLVAIGQDDQAGIGSEEDEDNGEIIIDGGTIFALSLGDGAGIGGGYEGGAGKITINGGTIWAESMSDDGAGIGVGDDGYGGEIIINGGDITALSLDDDGAGIGGADSGYVDSITINGGNIVAGSDDAAAIGGGQESDSFGGKITINGGNISASEWHNVDENLIGNGNDNSKGEGTDNFVQINGGFISTSNSNGIFPAPKDKNGNVLEEKKVTVHDSLIGKEITIELSNGSKITVTADDNEVSVYAPKNASVSNEAELATGYCDHMCHQGGIMGFFWKIVNFFSKLFGSNPVCGCGEAHY